MERHAVHGGHHPELAHAPVDVTPGALRPDRPRLLPARQVRAGQVGRAPHQLRQQPRHHLDRVLRGLPGRDLVGALRRPRERVTHRVGPRGGEIARHAPAQLGGERRVGARVGVERAPASGVAAPRRGRGRPTRHEPRPAPGRAGASTPARRARRAPPPAPSGAPWTSCVPAFVGAPFPITVRQQRSDGRRRSLRATAIAGGDVVRVVPVDVADHLPAVRVEPARQCRPGTIRSTRPSIEIPLSSQKQTSFPSSSTPASDAASCDSPSMRQPSPRNTYVK